MKNVGKLVISPTTYVLLISGLLLCIPLPYGYSTGALLLVLLVSLASLKYHKPEWNKIYLLPMLFYLLMVLSLLWTINLKDSLRGLERELALVVIPAVFVFMPSLTSQHRNKIFYYFSLGMAAFAVFFIGAASIDYLMTNDKSTFFYHDLVSPLELNAIYVSLLTSVCLVFLIFKTKNSITNILAALVLAIFLLLLSSKTIIVATFISSIFGIFQIFKKKKTVSFLFILFAVIILFFLLFPNPIGQRFNREVEASNLEEVMTSEKFTKIYDWTGTTIRLFQARIFYEMLSEDNAFFTGYGINASKQKIIEKQEQYNLYKGFQEYNFHNQYIQAWAETGVFGLICILLFLAVIFKQYLVEKDILLLSFFLIMAAGFMTESYLWRQRGLFHFLLLFCLFIKTFNRKGLKIST